MPTVVESMETQSAGAPPAARPPDEAVWQAWIAKGRAQDRRSSATQSNAMKWISIVGLLAAVGLSPFLTMPYSLALRFLLAVSAIVLMFRAFGLRHYAFAAVFGALTLLYNPIAPVFDFSGGWQRVVVLMSVLPFVAALISRKERLEHNG